MDPELYRAVGDEKSFESWKNKSDNWKNLVLEKTSEDNNVLHVAALNNQPNIVKTILQQCHIPSSFVDDLIRWIWHIKESLLYETNSDGDTSEFITNQESLLYETNSDGDTSLHLAARVGSQEIVQLLINHANAKKSNQFLTFLGKMKKLSKVVNLVKDTALHDAVRNGHVPIVELLIKEDPELVLLRNSAGESPLFLAVERKFFDIAEKLLDIETVTCCLAGRDGMNALHVAVHLHRDLNSNDSYANDISDADNNGGGSRLHGLFKRMIIKNPLAVEEQDDVLGWTPIHYAVHFNLEEVIDELLLENKKSASKKDKAGMSAFHIATQNIKIGMMEKLIRNCPDVLELLTYNGETALHIAVRIKDKKVVKYLLSRMGSSLLNKQDKDGNTPLHLAAKIDQVAKLEASEKEEDYGLLLMLLNDSRVKGTFVNNDGLTAMDIFQSCNKLEDSNDDHQKLLKEKLRSVGAFPSPKRELMDRNIKLQNFVEIAVDSHSQLAKDKREEKKLEKNKENIKRGGEKKYTIFNLASGFLFSPDSIPEKVEEMNILLVTLIATVSFAVALQVPGGYESDGPYLGLPVLRNKYHFKVFIILDAVAFGLSSASIILHFMSSMMPADSMGRALLLRLAQVATYYSILGMVGTFISGIYLVSGSSPVYACVVALSFFPVYPILLRIEVALFLGFVRLLQAAKKNK